MRLARYTGQFKRDVKRAQRRGKDMEKLRRVINLLLDGQPRPYSDQTESLFAIPSDP